MMEALTEIGEAAEDHSTVVVVSHGLSSRVGACRFVGLPFPQWRLFGGLSNCAWVSIARHRSGAYWRIEGYNLTANSDLEID
jgi:broad specificity phosphatase PhoE